MEATVRAANTPARWSRYPVLPRKSPTGWRSAVGSSGSVSTGVSAPPVRAKCVARICRRRFLILFVIVPKKMQHSMDNHMSPMAHRRLMLNRRFPVYHWTTNNDVPKQVCANVWQRFNWKRQYVSRLILTPVTLVLSLIHI